MPSIVEPAEGAIYRYVVIGLTAALTLLGCSAWASPASIDSGRRLAETQCGSCHAVGKAGDSRIAAATPFRALKARNPTASLDEIVAGALLTSHQGMPRFSGRDDQIQNLIDYLETLKPDARSP
jgi:mono/diheme cytochrome c family protein